MRCLGERFSTLTADRSNVDQCSLWNGITTLALGSFAKYFLCLQLNTQPQNDYADVGNFPRLTTSLTISRSDKHFSVCKQCLIMLFYCTAVTSTKYSLIYPERDKDDSENRQKRTLSKARHTNRTSRQVQHSGIE